MKKLSVVGIDIAKQVFHLVGVVSQKWRSPFLHRPSKGIAVDKQARSIYRSL